MIFKPKKRMVLTFSRGTPVIFSRKTFEKQNTEIGIPSRNKFENMYRNLKETRVFEDCFDYYYSLNGVPGLRSKHRSIRCTSPFSGFDPFRDSVPFYGSYLFFPCQFRRNGEKVIKFSEIHLLFSKLKYLDNSDRAWNASCLRFV